MGQRQHAIDTMTGPDLQAVLALDRCRPFRCRSATTDPVTALANYGALARDGISCASLPSHGARQGGHREVSARSRRTNASRRSSRRPIRGFTGFAATFTGNFFVGPPNELYGPFKEPKKKPMKHAIGIDPAHSQTITNAGDVRQLPHRACADPARGKTIGHVYEQTTYPEWAFSDFRTGDSPDGALPYGSGPQAQSCQGCHMPNKDAFGNPYRSKIAAIQEYSNFPQAEHTLPAADIDLQERAGFGKHTLVGLNVYLLKMAWQFPDTARTFRIASRERVLSAHSACPDRRIEALLIIREAAIVGRVTIVHAPRPVAALSLRAAEGRVAQNHDRCGGEHDRSAHVSGFSVIFCVQ